MQQTKKILSLLLALTLALGLTIPAAGSENILITRITIKTVTPDQPASELTINMNEIGLLTAQIAPGNATNQTLFWSSENPNIAAVAPNGVTCEIRPQQVGTTVIRAAAMDGSGAFATCTVTVVYAPPERIELNTTEATVTLGTTGTQLSAQVFPLNANQEVDWSSSDINVATVDRYGRVTTVKPGDVTITATSKADSRIIASCVIHVTVNVSRIELQIKNQPIPNNSLTMDVGEKQAVTAVVTPDNADTNVVWTSNATGIVSVTPDANNKTKATLEALNPGYANITASVGGRSTSVTVHVPTKVTGITLSDTEITLIGKSKTHQLTAVVLPDNATNRKLNWTSSDANIAQVDANGIVTAVSAGTATITAEAADGSGIKATCTVHVETPERGVQGITITDYTATMAIGDERYITAYVWPLGTGMNRKVIWTVDSGALTFEGTDIELNHNVAGVTRIVTEADGATGFATIEVVGLRASGNPVLVSATTMDGEFVATCLVSVEAPKEVAGILLDESNISVIIGGSARDLTATLVPTGAVTTVHWDQSSADGGRVSITTDSTTSTVAHVTGVTAGQVVITAWTEAGRFTATCKVNVTDSAVPATHVEIRSSGQTVDNVTLEVDRPLGVTAVLTPSNTTDTVTWTSSDPSIVVVENGTLRGISPGETTVVATAGTVSAILPVAVSGIVVTPNNINPLPVGGNTSILRTPYGEAKKVTGWDWTSSDFNIARVNAATGQVTAVAPGTITVTCTGGGYSATCQVQVRGSGPETIEGKLANGQLSISSVLTKLQNSCKEMTYGGNLRYITGLTVPTSQGTLYDGYVSEPDTGAGVSSTRRYYVPNNENLIPLIADLYFVPRMGFAGNAMITYTGYSDTNEVYTGYIVIMVPAPGDVDSVGISYASREGEPIQFHSEDFSAYAQLVSERSIRYVTFTLPSAQRGTLQYAKLGDGLYEEPVRENVQYAGVGSPSIDNIWFVPKTGYSGAFTIHFRGVDAAMNTVEGNILIKVGSAGSADPYDVSYTVAAGQRVYFQPVDFDDACHNATGFPLNYIYFDTVTNSRGTLYQTDGTSQRAAIGTSYYRTPTGSYHSIADLNFQANETNHGTAILGYTGVSTSGDRYTGTVRITVTSGNSGDIQYDVFPGQRVSFNPADFNNVCRSVTGNDLDYIRFSAPLPAASRGSLSCNGAAVTTAVDYYYNTRGYADSIEGLAFTAANAYTGTFDIPFTGFNNRGRAFTGSVTIIVSPLVIPTTPATTGNGSITYYSSGEPISLVPADFVAASASKLKYELKSIRFTQPDSSQGRLCLDYVSPTSYQLADGTRNFEISELSRVSFQPKGGFTGTANILFYGADITGKTYTGHLMVQVSPRSNSYYFYDMEYYGWAAPAVDFLASNGIVNGTEPGTFSPGALTKRADFVVMLSRAFSFPYVASSPFRDVTPGVYYASAVSAARNLGIAAGDPDGNFRPDGQITRQDAAVFLYRTMSAMGSMPAGTYYDLAEFPDRTRIADYAVEAMASLVRIGVLTGDDHRQLNPTGYLTRAEMAALFYRAIT